MRRVSRLWIFSLALFFASAASASDLLVERRFADEQQAAEFAGALEESGRVALRLGERVHFVGRPGKGDVVLQNITRETLRQAEEKRGAPKEDFFAAFRDLEEFEAFLDRQESDHSDLASRVEFPVKSSEGRTIRGLRLSRGDSTAEKRVILITGGIHAREWLSPMSVAWMIHQFATNSSVQDLLEHFEWHVFPVINVDGFRYTHQSPDNRLWRKTRTPTKDPKCPGIDPNRNFPTTDWGAGSSSNPCSQVYKGEAPLTTGVTQGLANYSKPLSHRLALFIDTHCYVPSFTSVWGYKKGIPPRYQEMMEYLEAAQAAIKKSGGLTFKIGTAANVIGVGAGGTDDYMSETHGIITSFTYECRGHSFVAPVSDILPSGKEMFAGYQAIARMLKSK